MSMAVNKKEFVERYLDDCVRHACWRVARVWYSTTAMDDHREENVTVVYSDGKERDIKVTGYSNLAIMKAVMDVLEEELI